MRLTTTLQRRPALEQLEDRCTPSGLGHGPANGTFLGHDLNRDDPRTASAESRGGAHNNIGQVFCSQERPPLGNAPGTCAVGAHEALGLPPPPGAVR